MTIIFASHHGWPWKSLVDPSQPWSFMGKRPWLTVVLLHYQKPWCHLTKHGRPCFAMVISPWTIMVDHGSPWSFLPGQIWSLHHKHQDFLDTYSALWWFYLKFHGVVWCFQGWMRVKCRSPASVSKHWTAQDDLFKI